MKSADSSSILPAQTLSRIIANVKENIPYARSLVLIGSRADDRYSVSDANSDYDVVVVVPGWRILRAIKASARAAARLSSEIDATISINPVPISKIRRPRGNFMVLKMLREGKTLSGTPIEDYAGAISEQDIDSSWHFFYMASQAKRLLDAMATLIGSVAEPDAERLFSKATYSAGKTIVACGEIRILVAKDRYLSHPQDVEPLLREFGLRELADSVSQASTWISSKSSDRHRLKPWLTAREILILTLDYLAQIHFGFSSINGEEFERDYLRSAGAGRTLKNLQYSALSLLKGSLSVRPSFSRSGIAERVKLALFYLLSATNGTDDFDTERLAETERLMSPLDREIAQGSGGTTRDRWLALYQSLTRIYPRACVALGI